MKKDEVAVGDEVKVVNNHLLEGNTIKPNLVLHAKHEVKDVFVCGCGEVHLDIGLPLEINYVSCYKCREELPLKNNTHWCNSIRFIKA
jgi:hypothetical protein